MPISDLCSKNLVCVEKSSTLQYVAHLMKEHHVGAVVVVESNGSNKAVGIITDRDIVLNVVAENRPLNLMAQDIMSTAIAQVALNEGIAEVADQMKQKGIRRMIVVDASGNACGLVTSDDILQLVAREIDSLGRMVERQIENEKIYRPHQKLLLN